MNKFLQVLCYGAATLSLGVATQASAQTTVQTTVQDTENSVPPPPCSTAEARQLDFWVGSWDLSWKDGGTGTNTITSEYDGCVIRENFSDSAAIFLGTSVSVYNPRTETWQQTWVDNTGSYLDFTGGLQEDGTFRLSRTVTTPKGTQAQRMTFYNIKKEAIDWDWEISPDGGESWTLQWRIHYERKG